LVPARGGSKGIPGKNGRLLGGVPLLARAVRAGFDTGLVERVLLTTDSAGLAAIGRDAGAEVPFLRPPELARDDTPMLPVMQNDFPLSLPLVKRRHVRLVLQSR
jgi:N-acylneuraminate cytidylyltransferase